MLSQRTRPLLYGLIGLVAVWLLAWGGYAFFGAGRATPEKVAAYLRDVDLASLSGAERAKALEELARKLNALTAEERRQARLDAEWRKWFSAMTDKEKSDFIDATVPSGMKQMLTAFEQLPEDKRRQAVEDALNNLRRARAEMEKQGAHAAGPPGGPPEDPRELSPELRDRMVQVGLKSFYTESSAQTKAELAPVLEEMQRLMERGGLFRPRRRSDGN